MDAPAYFEDEVNGDWWVSWAGPVNIQRVLSGSSRRLAGDPRRLAPAPGYRPVRGGPEPIDHFMSMMTADLERRYRAFTPIASVGRDGLTSWIFDHCHNAYSVPAVRKAYQFYVLCDPLPAIIQEARNNILSIGLPILERADPLRAERFRPLSRRTLNFCFHTEDEAYAEMAHIQQSLLDFVACLSYHWALTGGEIAHGTSPPNLQFLFRLGVGDWRMDRRGAVIELEDSFGHGATDMVSFLTLCSDHNVSAVYRWRECYEGVPALSRFDPVKRGASCQQDDNESLIMGAYDDGGFPRRRSLQERISA